MYVFFSVLAVFHGVKYLFSKAGVGKQTWKRSKTELEVNKAE